jgi:hypothetical protein
MKLITNFFNALESDALNKIELTVKSTAVAEEWPVLTSPLAWKSKTLTKLYLRQWVSYNHEIPDVLELMPLAQHCSHLETLALVLDATSINPYAKEKPRAGVCNLTLLKLDVVELPVDSPAAVASFLSAIFPNLWKVSSCKDGERNILMPDGEENMVEWASVGALVRVIFSAWAQEHYFPGTMLVDGE